ncbi:MAG: TonB-dependent receptor [Flavisolibacter sp.]|jgi:outer membrane receptor protein involved in Fe transport|nr:TonB-dependent receptor [Flavisolibacter sp.]
MRNLLFLILTIVIALAASAQNQGKISGHLTDVNQKTVESATITLIKGSDSTIVKFAIADKSGQYSFENLSAGSYIISVSAVGFQTQFSELIDLTPANPIKQLPVITLLPVTKSMDAVVVTAKKPLIEQRIDRTIVNVEASVTNVGSTALEVLEKAPGVTVDKDGNISLKGKEGVVVLIDGRPTQLSNADLANMLRSMNASQLDQLEIMTNPPAKFDAAGNAGVINIKTKKNKQFGYSGSLSLGYGQGFFPKYNEGLNLNYRKGKVNLFTNLSHNYRKGFQELDIKRNFRDKNSKELISSFDQEARMNNESNNFSGKLGLDYSFSSKTTLGVVFTGMKSPGTFTNTNQNNIYDVNQVLTGQTRAYSIQNNKWQNYSANLNFRHVLDSTGKEITADVDYIRYDILTSQTLSNGYFKPSGEISGKADTLYGHLPQEINIYSGKIDYLHPLKNGARFEAGLKSSFVKTDNNAIYDTLHNGTRMRDFNRSNYFIYEEQINAAYVNISGSISKKWNGQLGLRAENTLAKGKQITTAENFERKYTQLFPTAYLQYKLTDNNSFVLNYGRRIRRPNYQSLNPFIEYLDRYTYQQGNPNLKPQFSHNIELSHSYKGFLTTTLNYTQTNDIIQQVIEQNEATSETYIKQSNIARQKQYGVSVNAGFSITKWWRTNLYVNGFYNRFTGIVNNENISIDAKTVVLNGSQQFTLGKTTTAEISGFYRTGAIEGVIQTDPMGMMSLGLSQQVLKGKGTLRLNVRDIFYTQLFRAKSKYGSVDAAFSNRSDSRVVNVGFTYRFSKGKLNGNQKKKSTGSASEEANRVGGGNN